MSPPSRRRAFRAAALTVSASTLAVGLVACGGLSEDSADGTPCGTTTPGITPTEVKLGMTWSDSGPSASTMTAFRAGVDARLHVVNDEEDGVFGRKITYAWRDDQADPKLNVTMVQELIDQENIFGFIYGSGGGKDSVELLQERNIPVTGLASNPGWQGKNNMFSWFYLGNGSSTAWGKYIRAQGGSRAAVFAIDGSATSEDFTQQFAASLKARDVEVVQEFHTTSAVTNYRILAQQIKAANIDTLGGILLPEVAANLLPELRKVGLALGGKLKVVLMPLGYDSSNLTKYGQSLAGVSIFTTIKPFEVNTPGQQKFRQAMNLYSPETQPPTQDSAVDGWLAADLFIRGLEEAGQCPTRESFISGLRAVKDYDSAGMTPEDSISLSTNYKNVSVCYGVIRVSQGGDAFEANPQAECGVEISPERMNTLIQQP
ncbi:ABC transporter substrate-binding protein [Frankia sp. CNm7]|uniref:ABC transporter substrate-binding protein n=1 Tax=Frankia nepalensis TaxID=1836974 RepID=A0A937UPX8_9ACTN|nr:ABC transporter substrate-binding protein [Frankia nepalensis]MBL7499084.1 ABC transporter substrate-binding protein [Frankia nepalensis]MBL7511430.1 ABC transporter substrate-binding protein [Frankia nepalensis]MBL7517055.1 ABC transporter substrate-binding protein [Frankia nepalensis]MBL7629533.1 ABC transporter substrate-binding protein [Frankia nepalensis]